MREYYYLIGLDKSPYNISLADVLHFGAASDFKVYAYITERTQMEYAATGQTIEDDSMFLNIPASTIGAMEKDFLSAQTPLEDFFGPGRTVQRSRSLTHALIDDKYTGVIPFGSPFNPQPNEYSLVEIYIPNTGCSQYPSITVADLVCWTDDLERLVKRGHIQKRPTKPPQTVTTDSTDEVAPIITADSESEVKRLQRTVAALALGLMKKHGTYNHNGEPNASQLAKLATEHLRDAASDRTPHGFSDTTVRQTIAAALKACPELKE